MNLIENRDEVIIEPALPARAAVIWLHGLGADGHDFVPIVPELDLSADAAVRFIFPHAPVRPVTMNNGLPMRAWYDILALSGEARQDAAGIRESAQRIRGYLQAQLSAGIAADKLVLAGFSQGAAMALHTGLRLDTAIAGLVALSGYLPLESTLLVEASSTARSIPLFIAHGRHDAIVPYAWGERAAQSLQEAQYRVEWHPYAMAHEVCDEELNDLGRWLKARLA